MNAAARRDVGAFDFIAWLGGFDDGAFGLAARDSRAGAW